MALPPNIREALDQLKSLDPEQIRGRDRLGALAFEDAPGQIRAIAQILEDLDQEDWDEIDPSIRSAIEGNLNGALSTVGQMQQLESTDPNALGTKETLESQLQSYHEFFQRTVRPLAITARIQRGIQQYLPAETSERLEDLRKQFDAAQNELAARTAEIRSLVESQRKAAGVTGAAELAVDYVEQANSHRADWHHWLAWLVVAGIASVVGGVLLAVFYHPSDSAHNGGITTKLFVDLLVIGLLLYAVRLSSLQFRVHRHLEAVARNKAAALSTFNRIINIASEPEVRTSIATVLARFVFASEETGFIDASADHVTLVERFIGPAVQRITQSWRLIDAQPIRGRHAWSGCPVLVRPGSTRLPAESPPAPSARPPLPRPC